jgi:tetratricopeptide (TPR) repeat protein
MRLVLFLMALLVAASTAHADERERARTSFRRGSQHYALGEYKEALVDFKEAYRAYEDPSFLFNIAQCERQLDMRADAIRAYRMYLVHAPDAPNRAEVKELIARLEHQLAEERATKAAPPPGVEPPRNGAAGAASTTAGAAPATTAPANLTLTAAPPPRHKDTPTYKKWWVWTIVGVVAAGGVATGLAIGLTQNNNNTPAATTSFGTASPF